ncbi:MAG: fibronectin type III domain-containing protein [Aquisalimonadaceae bacterium]
MPTTRRNEHAARRNTVVCAALAFAAAVLLAGCVEQSESSSASGGNSPSPSSSSGPIMLSWVAPTTRQDGSPISLSDIDGYEVHYGTKSGNYTQKIETKDNEATVSSLQSGKTYYFAVKATDSSGNSSNFSQEKSTKIN